MCNQAVNNYALECVPECHKTQEMYDKVANAKLSTKLFLNALRLKKYLMKLFFAFDFVPDWYQTQEICDRVFSEIISC